MRRIARKTAAFSVTVLALGGGVHAQTGAPRQVEIRNESHARITGGSITATTITNIYSTPSGYGYWGRNLAPGNLIEERLDGATEGIRHGSAGTITYANPQGCLYDFRVVYGRGVTEDPRDANGYGLDSSGIGDTEERRGVNICDNGTLVFNGADRRSYASEDNAGEITAPRRFELVNRYDREIKGVFVSGGFEETIDEVEDWGANLLGNTTVRARQSTTLTVNSRCYIALRVTFAGNAAAEQRTVDICGSPRLTLQRGWQQSVSQDFIEYAK